MCVCVCVCLHLHRYVTGLFLGLSWGRNKAPFPMPN